MAICKYLILVIFGQFWLLRADFAPKMWKVYLFQLFRCKNINGIKKMGPCGYFKNRVPEPTLGPKTPKNGPRRAKIGVNAPHVVQLTGFGPKKTNLNRSVPRCVPFSRNQPTSIGPLALLCFWQCFKTPICPCVKRIYADWHTVHGVVHQVQLYNPISPFSGTLGARTQLEGGLQAARCWSPSADFYTGSPRQLLRGRSSSSCISK